MNIHDSFFFVEFLLSNSIKSHRLMLFSKKSLGAFWVTSVHKFQIHVQLTCSPKGFLISWLLSIHPSFSPIHLSFSSIHSSYPSILPIHPRHLRKQWCSFTLKLRRVIFKFVHYPCRGLTGLPSQYHMLPEEAIYWYGYGRVGSKRLHTEGYQINNITAQPFARDLIMVT